MLEGAGVALLSSCNFPYSTNNSTASFPEASFGYVPDCSSIYQLTKMKGEVGTFLALTGYEVKGSELVGLGLTNGLLDNTGDILVNEIYQEQLNLDHNINFNKYRNNWDQDYDAYKNSKNPNHIDDNLAGSEQYKLDINRYNKVFEYPWKQDTINNDINPQNSKNSALVNDLIKMQGKEYPADNFKLRNYNKLDFTNTLSRYQTILNNLFINNNEDFLSLDEHLKEINRCFRFDTIEEIKEALETEKSDFSEFCLKRLNKKSPISLAVTLRMLRNARKLDYSEIIKQEITVVKNIILRSKDFDIYMGNKINRQKTQFENRTVSHEEVDSFFEEVEVGKINLDLQQHSLLPNRDYIHKYPDCLKFLVNENTRGNEHVRKYFDYESFHYLMSN
jgi:enoyl-CoA hydratase/carnithine racemase